MDYKKINRTAYSPSGYRSTPCQPRSAGTVSAKTVLSCAGNLKTPEKQLAMVYAPYQNFEDLYAVEKGFYTGTIFAQLDLPCISCTSCRMNKQGGMRYE